MKKLFDKIPDGVKSIGLFVIIYGGLVLILMLWDKNTPPPKKYYEDIRDEKLGKQFIYDNDSIYITHVILDSVIVDTVDYRDENGEPIEPPDNDNTKDY